MRTYERYIEDMKCEGCARTVRSAIEDAGYTTPRRD